jgi:hypothetical protein
VIVGYRKLWLAGFHTKLKAKNVRAAGGVRTCHLRRRIRCTTSAHSLCEKLSAYVECLKFSMLRAVCEIRAREIKSPRSRQRRIRSAFANFARQSLETKIVCPVIS